MTVAQPAGVAPGASPSLSDAQAHVAAVTRASGTSFGPGMKVLPKARRQAMFGLYAFCREVDDIADEGGSEAEKRAGLAAWRREIDQLYAGAPQRLTALALLAPVRDWDLPRDEFLEILDGMEMDVDQDADPGLAILDWDGVRRYCRRVAGAVGVISVRIFGATEPEAKAFAIALGEAFQLTNILRDLAEDAARGRLYLPREALDRAGVVTGAGVTAPQILADPALPAALAEVAEQARDRFAEARRLRRLCRKRPLVPALMMRGVYELYLGRMARRGWQRHGEPLAVPKWRKLAAGLAEVARG